MYFMIEKSPYLAFALAKPAQFCKSPTSAKWKAVKRVLHYTNRTGYLGIFFSEVTELDIN